MSSRTSTGALLCFVTSLILADQSLATIDLVHELTINIPNLSGPVTHARFGDIDSDGFPEVLLSDGHSVYLYSVSSSKHLVIAPIDSAVYVPGEILFKDVDRDNLPDIVIEMWPKNAFAEPILLRGFSSTDNYSSPKVVSFGPNIGYLGIGVPGRITSGVLEAVDSDNDGYNELLFSYDSVVWSGIFPLDYYYSVGDIFSFHSFPDSMAWSAHGVLTNVTHIDIQEGSKALIGDSFSFSQYSGHGPDWSRTESRLTEIGTNGDIIRLPTTFEMSCNRSDNNNNSSFESLVSSGSIDIAGNNPDLLVRIDWSYHCGIPGFDEVDSSGAKLDLYEYFATDSMVKIWSLDITGEDYSNFVYHPDFPGSFFAIYNQRVTQFMGSDGSAYQASGLVPQGNLSWEYPYGDDRLRLVSIDGDSIAFYFLGIPTDVEGDTNVPLPQTFTLSNPYPNPFNPTSIISFSLPKRGWVTVDVYNVIGQRVTTIFDGEAPAGVTEIEWEAGALPSGVYFIRANNGGISKTVKALLLK